MFNKTIPTTSPINPDSLETQNKRLYDYLAAGHTINFMQAMDMKIMYLNSRIADLGNNDVQVYSRFIKIRNISCKEYSLQPFTDR